MTSKEVYPITANLEEELAAIKDRPFVKMVIETVVEYEHGTADVEDVADGMTIEMYAAVALDLAQSVDGMLALANEDDLGEPDLPRKQFEILNQRLWEAGQSVERETFLRFGVEKLLVEQRHDSYRPQSYSRIKRWDGSQWQYVAHVPPEMMASHSRKLSSALPKEKFIGAFDTDLENLEELARIVLEV